MNRLSATLSTTERHPLRVVGVVGLATLLLALLGSRLSANDQVPGKPQSAPILLAGGTIHTASGETIKSGWVLFDGGKITGVGAGDPPAAAEGTKVVRIDGKRVYPGLISIGNDLGLTEIPAVRAVRDGGETGSINPNIRAERSVNPDSEIIPVTRANGILINLTAPNGGVVTGTSAILQLDGWTWEDMTLKAPAGLHVAWPRMATPRGATTGGEDDAKAPSWAQQVQAVQQVFDDARAYAAARSASTRPAATRPGGPDAVAAPPFDARLEAMLPVLDGKIPLIVWADELRQIQTAVAFAVKNKAKLVLVGGYDAGHCVDLLKKHDVAVVISGTQRTPMRRDADYDEAYTLPARLHEAGLTYCISYGGRFSSNLRNLPYHAGQAVAFGLPADEAVRALTLHPARILGIADRVGSLEVGKDATLIVTDGDILETPTQVEQAFIGGRAVDLSSRHTLLWKKYQEKYR